MELLKRNKGIIINFTLINQPEIMEAKKKVHKLTNVEAPVFHVIGIASHDKPLTVSFELNKCLEISLGKEKPLELPAREEGEPRLFEHYAFHDESLMSDISLVCNRGKDSYLVESHRNLDFFLLISGQVHEHDLSHFLIKVKQCKVVLTAILLELPQKSKQHFTQLIR